MDAESRAAPPPAGIDPSATNVCADPTVTFYLPDASRVTVRRVAPLSSGVLRFTCTPAASLPAIAPVSWTAVLSSPTTPASNSDTLTINADGDRSPAFHLWVVCNYYFSLVAPPAALVPGKPGSPRGVWTLYLNRDGLFADDAKIRAAEEKGLILHSGERNDTSKLFVTKPMFWQVPYTDAVHSPLPPVFTLTNNVRHPVRPRPREGELLYRRYIGSFASFLSMRVATVADALLLNNWMNNPRVAAFWREEGPLSKTEEFLRKGLSSMHSLPVIASWSTEGETNVQQPFAYFEIYWVKEDHLANHTNAANWDRGFHVLVGEERFRGSKRVKAWLGSLVHYCFLDDPRTMTLYLEPRVDNEK